MVLPALPDSIKQLEFIAKNMFWSWNPEFIGLFKRIDSKLWKASGHNPVKLLSSVSQDRFEALAENQGFIRELERMSAKLKSYLEGPTWFQQISPKDIQPVIAYFSAEFGIHECLPVYSGGLGVLAGDHLKTASDLGVPMVGVSLLYQKGYFRQYLNVDGWQQEVYIENDFFNMPVELVKQDDGQPVTVSVDYPDGPVQAQIWRISIGRTKLYLLDTNIAANSPQGRIITASLYGGDREMRIRQEIMLGIGGMRALMAMGIEPTVCHMNEGHAAFMALERIRYLMSARGLSFDEAMEATKAANVFTIHTPVKAGNDEFQISMIEKYFQNYFPALGISKEVFLGLGRVNPEDEKEAFKMPVLALRLSSYRNGVSKLHGQVSRKMWSKIWPDVPVDEIPIKTITNGAHIKSWLSEEMHSLYDRYLGSNWAETCLDGSMWENIEQIPDEEFWRAHQRNKGRLIAFSRSRLKSQIQRRGTYHSELNLAEEVLDPEALTIGFARRFATYKRGYLLFKDPKRIIKLLSNSQRPVQLIFAGKAHPNDTEGKEIIRQIIHFASQYDVRRRIVFLENYDIDVARYLVRGVDIWLNTPRPPMEASGTSGMKAAFNGVLNLSTWDGWWCEGYTPEGGWSIGAGESYDDAGYQDIVESQAIYNILENEVVPLFYTRSSDGLPRAWIHRMKTTIKWVTPRFNTNRMTGEYTEKSYNPAAANWQRLTDEAMSRAKELSRWKSYIKSVWPAFAIKDVQIQVGNGQKDDRINIKQPRLKVGSQLDVRVLVKLGQATPQDVAIELYHGRIDSWGNIENGSVIRMEYREKSENEGEHWFTGVMSCKNSGRQGLAVRVLPNNKDLVNPYELGLILWERGT
jgi:starch phosphorylase